MNNIEIISYNVNGIRAAIKKGFDNWVKESNCDIYCLQETKAHKEQVETDWLADLGYHQYWFSAEKKGYSGLAVFTKTAPKNVITGMDNALFDSEGRTMLLEFENFALLNVYFPSGSSGSVRQDVKMEFLEAFMPYAQHLTKKYKHLVVCGDYNIAHTEIDIHNPKSNKNSSGFLPEERNWLSQYLDNGFIDTFRLFNQTPHHYSWWSYRANARANNKGWRIDYITATKIMKDRLLDAQILPNVKHSDHCPIYLKISS